MIHRRFDRDRESGLLLPRGLRGTHMAAPQQMLMSYGGAAAASPHTRMLHFNGGNGDTSTVDSSADAATVTMYSTAQLSTAQVKYGTTALDLTGASNPYCGVGIPTLNIRTDPFCYQGWFRPTSDGTLSFLTGLSASRKLYLIQISGTVYLGDGSTNPIAASHTFSAATWVHVALDFDGTTYRVFFDGTLWQSTTTLLASQTIDTITIGGDAGQVVYFPGYIDDVAWDVTSQYTANFTPPSELD